MFFSGVLEAPWLNSGGSRVLCGGFELSQMDSDIIWGRPFCVEFLTHLVCVCACLGLLGIFEVQLTRHISNEIPDSSEASDLDATGEASP